MTIPVDKINTFFSKSAAKPTIGESMLKYTKKGAGKTAKFIWKHPKSTVGVMAAALLATGAADRVHDLYNITSEMRKRKVMRSDVVPTLQEIAKNTKRVAPAAVKKQKLFTSPLS